MGTRNTGRQERGLKDEKTAAAQQMLFTARTETGSSPTRRGCLFSAPPWLSITRGTKIPSVQTNHGITGVTNKEGQRRNNAQLSFGAQVL